MTRSERTTKIVFWLAFGAFLAMSIPHVAWVFHHYEPQHDGYSVIWWPMSYGVAIGIDVLICWLSYTRSEQHSSTRGDAFITWTFIFLLALLSWYCNWLFAETMIGADVWAIALFWGWTVGSLTPLIASAIPMFLIAYTYMSKRILGTKPMTIEELTAKKQELERTSGLLKDIEKLQVKPTKEGWIARSKKTALELKNAVQEVTQNPGQTVGLTSVKPAVQERQIPGTVQNIETSKMEVNTGQTDSQLVLSPELSTLVSIFPNIAALLSTGQKTATYKEVENALGQSHMMVVNRVKDGTLRRTPRNDKLVLMISVIEWAKTLGATMQSEPKTIGVHAVKPQTKILQNPVQSLGMVEQKMYDALSKDRVQFAELLRLSDTMAIPQLTTYLKERYSSYAVHINERRVETVLTYARRMHPELHNGHHAPGGSSLVGMV